MALEDMEFGSYDAAERKARMAYELYEDGKISQAIFELETALEINPANGSWHFDKGLALDTANRFDDAINEYEIALQLDPSDVEILNSLAVDYTRTGQYDLAIATFEQIESIDPDYEPSYCNRIIAYTEMGLHDLAEQMFYLGQQVEADCALCYYNIGNSLFVRGQYEKAIHCWHKTAELEPTHPQINYRIAQAYWLKGNTDLAREYLLEEIRQNPGDINVILDFGLLLLQIGDIESAKEKFNRILEFDPNSAEATFYLGEIAFSKSNFEQSFALFNQAIENNGSLKGPRFRLAQSSLMAGQTQKARSLLLCELTLVPDDCNVLISMASMFLSVGDIDHATHCLLKALDTDSACAKAYYYLGLTSAASSRFENAAEFLEHALDIDPNDICAMRDCAMIYLVLSRFDLARERIEKAISLAGDDSQLKWLKRKIRLARTARQTEDFLGKLVPRLAKSE